jgi:hypothetical protein
MLDLKKGPPALSFLVAERLLEALACLGEPITRTWLLHPFGDPMKGHLGS